MMIYSDLCSGLRLAVSRFALAWTLVCVAGCASNQKATPTGPARVSVEVHRGLANVSAWPTETLPRVEVVVDVSSSMRSFVGSVSRADAAQSGAMQLIQSLPSGTEIGLHALGHVRGGACTAPQPLTNAFEVVRRETLEGRIAALRSQSESSLAETLLGVHKELSEAGAAGRARVVVYTDLEDGNCGGDLCAAAQEIIGAGGQIDLVLLGTARPPACLRGLTPGGAPPGPLATTLVPAAPTYQIVEVERTSTSFDEGTGAQTVTGRTGGQSVEVRPGLVMLTVDLDTPERIGPFNAPAGTETRVRVIDFPTASPPLRSWRVERQGFDW